MHEPDQQGSVYIYSSPSRNKLHYTKNTYTHTNNIKYTLVMIAIFVG